MRDLLSKCPINKIKITIKINTIIKNIKLNINH